MVKPFEDENEDKPLDPAVERVRRKLVRFVAINIGILLAALMAVLVALVYRAGQTATPAGEGAAAGSIVLPAGARVMGHGWSEGRLSIDAEMPDGSRVILLFDSRSGEPAGRIEVISP